MKLRVAFFGVHQRTVPSMFAVSMQLDELFRANLRAEADPLDLHIGGVVSTGMLTWMH